VLKNTISLQRVSYGININFQIVFQQIFYRSFVSPIIIQTLDVSSIMSL